MFREVQHTVTKKRPIKNPVQSKANLTYRKISLKCMEERSRSLGELQGKLIPHFPSIHIRRSDIEWRRLRWLIGKHVVIVKKVWEFTAQPFAQRTFERLGRAMVVGSASKNDNKAHVS